MTLDAEFGFWIERLAGRRTDQVQLTVDAILESQSKSRGGSLPFKSLCSDGNVYWIKMLNNRQSDRMLATELVVSECGRLIGAPVCRTAVISIPAQLNGEVLDNGTELVAGLAHGSLNVANSLFSKWFEPEHRSRDDNRKRHAGYFALYDWCWGDDMQWLYDLGDDWKTYSHDHGLFLPGGTKWNQESLVQSVNIAHDIDPKASGLEHAELLRIANRLDSIRPEELSNLLAKVPKSWPVDDNELAVLGWFLSTRATSVADRLRALAQNNPR